MSEIGIAVLCGILAGFMAGTVITAMCMNEK